MSKIRDNTPGRVQASMMNPCFGFNIQAVRYAPGVKLHSSRLAGAHPLVNAAGSRDGKTA